LIVAVIEGGRSAERRDWLADLQDERAWVRQRAAAHLAEDPAMAAGAATMLAAALGDRNPQVRHRSALALAAAGAVALDVLAGTLGHARPVAREWAAVLLGRLGPAAREALPALNGAARDEEWSVRRAAADAIRSIEGAAAGTAQCVAASGAQVSIETVRKPARSSPSRPRM
jgi:HEAT repeat protein